MYEYRTPLAFVAASILLSACVGDPTFYETAPVQVRTSKGVVTCQLYQRDIVKWDRAIDRPENMKVKEADAICLAEGARRANAD